MLAAPMSLRNGTPGCKRFPVLAALALSLAVFSPCSSPGALRDYFFPWSTVEGRDGKFYGSMLAGGVPGGSVYSLSPGGDLLKPVCGFPRIRSSGTQNLAGSNPANGLAVGQDGSIYGSTLWGGAFGMGVLFKIDPKTGYKVLHHFDRFSYHKGSVVVAENGDVFVYLREYGPSSILRLSKDGSHTIIPVSEDAMSIAETANHEIIVGTYRGNAGTLWRLNSSDMLEPLADVGYYPHTLRPLPDGSVLCLTFDRLLQVSSSGEVSVIREFNVPFEGLNPNFITVAKDGSYIGSTSEGGLELSGTVFRIVPGSNEFTLLSHFHAPGRRGEGVDWMKDVFPLLVAAESGNRPPMAKDDIVVAASLKARDGGLPQVKVPVLVNDSDADKDPLTITSVSTPEHGVANLDYVSQTITYTANSAQVENDSFTYTIVDGSGGTSIGHVIVRTNPAGKYTGDLSSPENSQTGDPGTSVGTLSVVVNANRQLTGRLKLLGKTYRFIARFNEVNQTGVVLESHPRLGQSAGLRLWLRPNGAKWTIEATILKNGLPYSGTCTTSEN